MIFPQILGIGFSLMMLYLTFIYYRRGEFLPKDFMVWSIVWISFMIVVIFHRKFSLLLKPLSFVRLMDMLMVFAFMFLTALSFYLHALVRENQNKIEELTREMAIREKR